MGSRRPAEAYDPRSHVCDELTARGMTEDELPPNIRDWMNGTASMGKITADGLSRPFGTSPEFWLELDASYQRWKEASDGKT